MILIARFEASEERKMIAQSSSEPSHTKETTSPTKETSRTRKPFIERRDDPAFTALAAKLFWGSVPARTVAVAACNPGEGTTFVAKSLQAFLSDDGRVPVSLVSAENFLASQDTSRSDYAEAVARRGELDSDSIRLVDCPPLFLSSLAIRTVSHVDGILLVVEDGARSKAEIQRAASMVEAAEGRILGVVLNKRRYLLPAWLYSLLS